LLRRSQADKFTRESAEGTGSWGKSGETHTKVDKGAGSNRAQGKGARGKLTGAVAPEKKRRRGQQHRGKGLGEQQSRVQKCVGANIWAEVPWVK